MEKRTEAYSATRIDLVALAVEFRFRVAHREAGVRVELFFRHTPHSVWNYGETLVLSDVGWEALRHRFPAAEVETIEAPRSAGAQRTLERMIP